MAIAVGGALGALARYGLGSAVTERTDAGFPWGTFVVNVTVLGSAVAGLVAVTAGLMLGRLFTD